MISAVELEKYVADVCIFSVVVGELRYEKKPYPIILLEFDKRLEVGFYRTILPFSLTVYLWVKGSREFPLYAEEIA